MRVLFGETISVVRHDDSEALGKQIQLEIIPLPDGRQAVLPSEVHRGRGSKREPQMDDDGPADGRLEWREATTATQVFSSKAMPPKKKQITHDGETCF